MEDLPYIEAFSELYEQLLPTRLCNHCAGLAARPTESVTHIYSDYSGSLWMMMAIAAGSPHHREDVQQ